MGGICSCVGGGDEPEPAKGPMRSIKMSEVKQHVSLNSLWFVIQGKVYDVTPFIGAHPGGVQAFRRSAGKDVTEGFRAKHDKSVWSQLDKYCIGTLDESGGGDGGEGASQRKAVTLEGVEVALQPNKNIQCELVEKADVSPDTRKLRFKLPKEEQSLGLPVGHHLVVNATIAGDLTMRSYTPTTLNDTKGAFELVVKVYFKGASKQFPAGGAMSQYLDSLKIGDKIEVSGPRGHFEYSTKGKFNLNGMDCSAKSLGFIAGGSGITPCFQVIKAILENKDDSTKCYLLYSNKAEVDILLRDELDAWVAKYPDQFKCYYTLSSAQPEGWAQGAGRIDEGMVKAHLPAPAEDCYIGLCGPLSFVNNHCVPLLLDAGHQSDHTWVF